ncbi:MAG: glycoside hydrolase family 10 protein [Phycisphaerales bacterium]
MLNSMLALVVALSLSPAALALANDGPWRISNERADQPPALAREFRGAWVATVANIDWPTKRTLSPREQHAEMLVILDAAHAMNLNAIVLQVRPACDAIYPSALEPWSEFLTGESGRPPADAPADYDPLRDWIAEAHARGLELHAWFNPFRARHFESKKPDASTHVSKARPDLVRAYDQYLWLDPSSPDAQTLTHMVVADVVTRYDIDGVHMDDYFYPYPKDKQPFPDEEAFQLYRAALGAAALPKAEWRREHVNRFVRTLAGQVHRLKPHVKVGISPFGIWRPGSPPGVQGFDQFEGLSADARRWIREGWVDYLAPQLYWKISAPAQPYQRLLQWWCDQNDQRRHIWPGNFTSRILATGAGKPGESWEPGELIEQIGITRRELAPTGSTGNIHFSMAALLQNRRGIADALVAGPYADDAIVPASPWLAGEASLPPAAAVEVALDPDGTLRVSWAPAGQTDAKSTSAPPQKAAVRLRYEDQWTTVDPGSAKDARTVDARRGTAPLRGVAITLLDAFGREGPTTVVVPGKPISR